MLLATVVAAIEHAELSELQDLFKVEPCGIIAMRVLPVGWIERVSGEGFLLQNPREVAD